MRPIMSLPRSGPMQSNNTDGFLTMHDQNNLLLALRPADLAAIEPHLEPLDGRRGDILYHPGDDVQRVYFPCGPTLIAFHVDLEEGHAVETAIVGREGALGGVVSQGRLPAFARAEVLFPGPLLVMGIGDLQAAKAASPALQNLFARYADCFMAQIFQSVACNAVHSIEQRTAKWLATAMERTGDGALPLTQEQLAGILGVGRSYVSRVLQGLKRQGHIETRRGILATPDRDALARLACGCQTAVRQHFDAVLEGVYPDAADG
jgi:Crp-like helix-turn-helix domain